jgi:hypothetical protein
MIRTWPAHCLAVIMTRIEGSMILKKFALTLGEGQ